MIFFFRKHVLSLSSITRDQYKAFRTYDSSNCKSINYNHIRQQIVEFLLFLRESFKRWFVYLYFKTINKILLSHFIIFRINSCESFKWLVELQEEKIVSELNHLHLTLGQFHNLSETILQHALSSSDSKVNCFIFQYL